MVRALIAHTNRGGEKSLRKLELRLLEAGRHRRAHRRRPAALSRQDDDRRRRRSTSSASTTPSSTSSKSRSFGIVTTRHAAGQGGDARCSRPTARASPTRRDYDRLVVSPESSRELLTEFIEGAKKQLLIYDAKVSDRADAEGAAGARQGGRRDPDHRQGRQGRDRTSRRASCRRCGCTCARSSATARRRSSAARACASWSSTAAARSASSSATPRSPSACRRSSRPTGKTLTRPKSKRRPPRTASPTRQGEDKDEKAARTDQLRRRLLALPPRDHAGVDHLARARDGVEVQLVAVDLQRPGTPDRCR